MGQEIEHLFNMITGLGAEEKKGELSQTQTGCYVTREAKKVKIGMMCL
jgi:hypothetical protein